MYKTEECVHVQFFRLGPRIEDDEAADRFQHEGRVGEGFEGCD